ncbi:hypothetical protein ACM39_16510 [Chryseobacterium sp. FH2]|uniref:hypothetical protein n=1 Tax=Chryseobacterium sp. FH2 TaxID=1674291 RepID=UPI00065AFD68|nr:hypothetical protein [Chryseobacterium sp. FH2]KMQ65284.1 hypothetical protein ACM39_16510 [Chryseobacterium sp. FH2]
MKKYLKNKDEEMIDKEVDISLQDFKELIVLTFFKNNRVIEDFSNIYNEISNRIKNFENSVITEQQGTMDLLDI